jgi:hypothetical protein
MHRLNTLIATAVAALAVVAMVLMPLDAARAASREKILHNFNGDDGGHSSSDLIFDAAGNLYGTTESNAFELKHSASGKWTEKVLHTFGTGTDGTDPKAGLIFDKAGNLYGTTTFGGTGKCMRRRPDASLWNSL